MKYYIIAGEASGDLHGANLIKAIKKEDPTAHIRCWGGDLMQSAGAQLAKHYKEMAFMGFWEVIKNLPKIFKNIAFCKKDILDFQPNAIIFIDFSGFNLRIAAWAKTKNFNTHYYIAPQIWASRESRIKKIKRNIDQLYVTLPFEKEFYNQKHNYPAQFVGHPLIDAISSTPIIDNTAFRIKNNLHPQQPIIALLPGSRKQEVQKTLALMLTTIHHFPEYQFVIAGAPSLPDAFYTPFLTKSNVTYISNQTYPLLKHAHAALVTSGTATLEAALFNVPQVVCYKGSWLSYQIAKRIITLKYISLVNLIMDKAVVTELIQGDFTPTRLHQELTQLIAGAKRMQILEDYKILRTKLGNQGASTRTALLITKNVSK